MGYPPVTSGTHVPIELCLRRKNRDQGIYNGSFDAPARLARKHIKGSIMFVVDPTETILR